MNNVFKCKTVKLKKFLMDRGFKYIWVDVDKDNWTYWVFERTPELTNALDEYNA